MSKKAARGIVPVGWAARACRLRRLGYRGTRTGGFCPPHNRIWTHR